jgi:hypothetical protein
MFWNKTLYDYHLEDSFHVLYREGITVVIDHAYGSVICYPIREAAYEVICIREFIEKNENKNISCGPRKGAYGDTYGGFC